jgi:hypothetical protein
MPTPRFKKEKKGRFYENACDSHEFYYNALLINVMKRARGKYGFAALFTVGDWYLQHSAG